MQPHYSQSSRENATPSSGTSPLAYYKEVQPPGLSPHVNNCHNTMVMKLQQNSPVVTTGDLHLKLLQKFLS